MSDFKNTIDNVKEMISSGGRSSRWFAQAYVSWYRNSDCRLVNLSGVERLDDNNLKLFWLMINLRREQGWYEKALYDLEQFAIEKWSMGELS